MKFLIAILFALSMLACETTDVMPVNQSKIELKKICIQYNKIDYVDDVCYYFDLENSICYTRIGGLHTPLSLVPVDFPNCYSIYVKYIAPNEPVLEKEE